MAAGSELKSNCAGKPDASSAHQAYLDDLARHSNNEKTIMAIIFFSADENVGFSAFLGYHSGVQSIAQSIADQVETQHKQYQRYSRKYDDVPVARQ